MKVAGVIVEYNPFHYGHLYHIEETKKKTNADLIIAVMSGQFLQRGEPALVSKWARTKMALEGGADLVIELPYVFATQKATTFALGAVSLLDALFADEFCFGSENGQINDFEIAIDFLNKNKQRYDELVKKAMKEGVSYPKASSLAFQSITGETNLLDLTQPNNILGFQYIKASREINSKSKPQTIKRTGSNYHDETFHSKIASATSIRKTLFKEGGTIHDIKSVVPYTTYEQLISYYNHYHTFHKWDDYFNLLKYRLITMTPHQLQDIYEAEEGLEYRLLDRIKECYSFTSFMESIKTKRYTWTRLQRLCLHILTNTSKVEMKSNEKTVEYIRLLGMSLTGQQYLRSIKKKLDLPLLSNISGYDIDQLNLDIKASHTYASILKEPLKSEFIKKEFSQPPIRYDKIERRFL